MNRHLNKAQHEFVSKSTKRYNGHEYDNLAKFRIYNFISMTSHSAESLRDLCKEVVTKLIPYL